MAINPNADFNELTNWLNENLLPKKSFVPHVGAIPNVKSKGIYFWYMQLGCYIAMSDFVSANPIEPKYTKVIEGVKYFLTNGAIDL